MPSSDIGFMIPVEQLTTKQALRGLLKEVATLNFTIHAHIEKEDQKMADLSQLVDSLIIDVHNEILQITEGMQEMVSGLTAENATLRTQLQAYIDQANAAGEKIQALSAELRANDPVPAPEPAPEPLPQAPEAPAGPGPVVGGVEAPATPVVEEPHGSETGIVE